MAHAFKMEEVDNLARIVSAVVSKDLLVANTVRRDFDAEFAGRRGTSVNVRIPATVSASTRALDSVTPLAKSTITEGTQAVSLSTNNYVVVELSDEDSNLRVEDFAEQILAPMALAIAEKIEDTTITALSGLTANAALGLILETDTPSTVLDTFVAARQQLRDMGAPRTGLYAVVSTDIYTDLLRLNITAANSGNASRDGLANADIPMVAGFRVLESNRLAPKTIYFYHRDAVTLVLRAPAVPQSVGWGSSQMVQGGVPVRITKSWDNDALAERTVMNVYSGTATLTAKQSTAGTNVLFAIKAVDAD